MTHANVPEAAGEEVGIGGWLILPVIGLFLTPLQGLVQMGDYSGLMKNMQYLTAVQGGFVWFEIIANLVIVVAMPIYLLVQLFQRKALFPKAYVVWAVANIVFEFLDLIAAQALFGEIFEKSNTRLVDGDTLKSILRSVVLVVVWVPYMKISTRVRNTFTA
jgi:hypothetical protein